MLNIPENRRGLKAVAPSLVLAVCLVAPPSSVAQGGGTDGGVQVDISGWSCEYCPDVSGWSGALSLGAYHVSDDSAKFGDYTGLNEQGGYLLLDGDTRYIGKDGYYMDLYFDDFGLDSRSISLEGGRQGSYEYSFSYNKLPHYFYDTARTPFTGGDTLTLPAGWVTAGTTGGMTALDTNLQDVDVFSERETVGVGAKLVQSSRWEYSADFSQSTKSGTEIIGGSFMNTSSLLPSPIDYTTDQAELKASYTGRTLQAQLGYYVSIFTNENKSLTWQNPFTEIAVGGDTGRLALEPDNSFHQLAASTAFQLDSSTATRLLAGFSVGHMQQDDDYLPATINPDLTTASFASLPRNTLDGEVDTLSYNVRLSTRPVRGFSLNLTIQYNERDNNTPVDAYEHVDTDVFVSVPRSNVPYSFERRKATVDMTYNLPNNIRIVTGVEDGSYERSLLGSSKTDEDRIWAEISTNVFGMVDFRLMLADESRRNSRIDWLTVFVTGENPYLQKFNMADRERDEASLSASVSPFETFTVSFTADVTDDDYFNSSIGLTDAEQTGYTLDFSWVPVKAVNLYWFASQESIESNMAGSTDFVGSVQFEPNWYAHQQDTIDTIGLGVEFAELFEKMDFGISYNRSESEGEINLQPVPASEFPDLVTDLDSANFYLKYRMSKSMGLRFSYLAERYKSNDWGFNNVEPDTIPAVLTPGQQIFKYDVNLVSVALDYRF